MRPIHLARMDKTRPVLVLTRAAVRDRMMRVTVAPITSRARGLTTELRVGAANGLDHDSVVSLDNIGTIAVGELGRQVGFLRDDQEMALTTAIHAAFDLDRI